MKAYGGRVGVRLLALLAVSAGFASVVAPPASAGTVGVAGVQSGPVSSAVCTDQTPGLLAYSMAGGLIGCWYTDTFNSKYQPTSGTFQATGTEHFVGCLDLDGDQACTGRDPQGTLYFTFQFTGKLNPVTLAEVHGRCQHPIISGTGDFANASGVITFKDDVTNGTSLYTGHVAI